MDKKNLKRKEKKRSGSRCQINMAISNELSNWLYKENLSPTAVFLAACKELGYKEEKKE